MRLRVKGAEGKGIGRFAPRDEKHPRRFLEHRDNRGGEADDHRMVADRLLRVERTAQSFRTRAHNSSNAMGSCTTCPSVARSAGRIDSTAAIMRPWRPSRWSAWRII